MKLTIHPGKVLVTQPSEIFDKEITKRWPDGKSTLAKNKKWRVLQIGSDVSNFGHNFPVKVGSNVIINPSYNTQQVIKIDDITYRIIDPRGIQLLIED
jgi:co-chaperonin GroES (HSP10)